MIPIHAKNLHTLIAGKVDAIEEKLIIFDRTTGAQTLQAGNRGFLKDFLPRILRSTPHSRTVCCCEDQPRVACFLHILSNGRCRPPDLAPNLCWNAASRSSKRTLTQSKGARWPGAPSRALWPMRRKERVGAGSVTERSFRFLMLHEF
jgi:hypothetical protein